MAAGGYRQPAERRAKSKTPSREPRIGAEVAALSVYAKQRVHGRDRAQLERLCRYVMRPPLSQLA